MKKYFEYYNYNNYIIIEILVKKFDLFVIPQVSKEVNTILQTLNNPDIIINLNNVNYIDSSGFGFLVSTRNAIDKNGKEMIIVCNIEDILHIMDIQKMHRFLKIFSNIEDASSYINQKGKE